MSCNSTIIQSLHALMDIADPLTLAGFRKATSVENKAEDHGFDPVTSADRATEAAVAAAVRQRFPTDGIIGEEFSPHKPDAARKWVIDPIDGTRAYLCGLPTWTTLIGLLLEGRPIAGMVSQPFIGERFFGNGHSAFASHAGKTRKLHVRTCHSMASAILCNSDPSMFARSSERQAFADLARQVRLLRYGTDAYGYTMLASGFVDLVVERDCKLMDILPLVPIVLGAGGWVINPTGDPDVAEGYVIAASSRTLAEEAAAMLVPTFAQ